MAKETITNKVFDCLIAGIGIAKSELDHRRIEIIAGRGRTVYKCKGGNVQRVSGPYLFFGGLVLELGKYYMHLTKHTKEH